METKTAKNSITETTKKGKTTLLDTIRGMETQFKMALPQHLTSERFTRIAITEIRKNPKLLECSQESVLGSLMTIAQLGLEPGVLGQAYLLPFNNSRTKTVECQLQISYKGMTELLRRTGQLKDIYSYTVYSNDEFEIEYGLERNLKHKPNFTGERGEIVGFYSVAILESGSKVFQYMTKKEVEEHEEKYRKGSYKNSIWDKNFEEMAMKTVAKKMLKWLPVSVEFIESIRKENSVQNLKNGNVVEEQIDYNNYESLEIIEIENKPSSEDMKTLIAIADGNGIDITKLAKEKYKIANLDRLTLEQYQELKEIAINGIN